MADLHILRIHKLGLPEARKVAFEWAVQAERDFSMDCSYEEGKTSDEVGFSRSGVKGSLVVTADKFELNATLGFLLGAFKSRIEGEIVKNLDALLAQSSSAPPAPPAPPASSAAAKSPAAKKAAVKK